MPLPATTAKGRQGRKVSMSWSWHVAAHTLKRYVWSFTCAASNPVLAGSTMREVCPAQQQLSSVRGGASLDHAPPASGQRRQRHTQAGSPCRQAGPLGPAGHTNTKVSAGVCTTHRLLGEAWASCCRPMKTRLEGHRLLTVRHQNAPCASKMGHACTWETAPGGGGVRDSNRAHLPRS